MRLIDADALYEKVVDYQGGAVDKTIAKRLIMQMDEAVVRCKDCKKNPHWEWVGCPMTGKNTRQPDDFCSYGERREDDNK